MTEGEASGGWTRNEALLTFSLLFEVKAWGRVSPSQLLELGELVGRSPGSISFKVADYRALTGGEPPRIRRVSSIQRVLYQEYRYRVEDLLRESERIRADSLRNLPTARIEGASAGFNYNISAVGMNLYSVPGSVSAISGTSIVRTITVGYVPDVMTFNPSNGQVYVSNLFSDNVTVINGSTNTVIRSIAVGHYPIGVAYNPDTGVLYVANALSGNVALIDVVPIYSVMFSESGLPSGTSWSVTLNGATQTSTSPTITFNEPNGTFGYTVATPISGGSGVRYVAVSSGSVTVNGNNAAVPVPYTTQYYLSTYSSPSTRETTSPLSGWYNASSTVTISATASSGYTFLSWTGTGTGSYTGTSASHTITMGAPLTEVASFGKLYAITFTETGLPSGTEWFVNLSNGQSFSSTTSAITFNEPNGTFTYGVATTNKSLSSNGGSFTVNGASVLLHPELNDRQNLPVLIVPPSAS